MENQIKHNITPLFPTPLYQTYIPPNLSSISQYWDSQEMAASNETSSNYGIRSKNSYILNETPCHEISDYILSHVLNFGKNYLNYAYESYKFSQSWISFKSPGEQHSTHTHSNSTISGVIYYGKWDSNFPGIGFHNTTLPGPTRPKMELNKHTPYSQIHAYFNPSPGMLLLFPSYLPHSVPINKTTEIRKSIAFNVVPTEGLGNELELTELKF